MAGTAELFPQRMLLGNRPLVPYVGDYCSVGAHRKWSTDPDWTPVVHHWHTYAGEPPPTPLRDADSAAWLATLRQ
jgi:hypothetical protein